MSKCKKCSKVVSSMDEAVMCEAGCQGWCHIRCVGISKEAYIVMKETEQLEWRCTSCKTKEKKGNRNSLQDGGQDDEMSKSGIERILEKQNMMMKEIIQVIVNEMKEMMKTILEGKVDAVQNEMFGISKRMDKMGKELKQIDEENYELMERCKRLERENTIFKKKIEKIENKDTGRELEIVVNGKEDINDEEQIKEILKQMDIKDARIEKVDGWKTKIGKVIKVKCESKEVIRQILGKRRLLKSSEGQTRIYINEVLDNEAKKIYMKAKWCVKEGIIEGVTTRDKRVGIYKGNKLTMVEDMEELDEWIRKMHNGSKEIEKIKNLKLRPPEPEKSKENENKI